MGLLTSRHRRMLNTEFVAWAVNEFTDRVLDSARERGYTYIGNGPVDFDFVAVEESDEYAEVYNEMGERDGRDEGPIRQAFFWLLSVTAREALIQVAHRGRRKP